MAGKLQQSRESFQHWGGEVGGGVAPHQLFNLQLRGIFLMNFCYSAGTMFEILVKKLHNPSQKTTGNTFKIKR